MTATETPTVVETLSHAAKVIKERADAATTPLPRWQALVGKSWGRSNAVGEGEGHPLAFVGEGDQAEADLRHMASWDPVVAKAVAAWLEGVATSLKMGPNHGAFPVAAEIANAHTVAKTYLRRSS